MEARTGTVGNKTVLKDASPQRIRMWPSTSRSSGQKREAVRVVSRLPTHRPSRSDWLGTARCSFFLAWRRDPNENANALMIPFRSPRRVQIQLDPQGPVRISFERPAETQLGHTQA